MATSFAGHGPRSTWVIFDGQSHNQVPSSPDGYPSRLMSGRGIPWQSVAHGGASFTGLLAGTGGELPAAERWAPYVGLRGLETCVLIVNGGTQDVLDGDSGAQILSDITAYATAGRTAGFTHIIATTIPIANGFTGPQDSARQDFNALLLADTSGTFDATVNLDLVLTDYSDPDQFDQFDQVHLSEGGAQLVADAVAPELDLILS